MKPLHPDVMWHLTAHTSSMSTVVVSRTSFLWSPISLWYIFPVIQLIIEKLFHWWIMLEIWLRDDTEFQEAVEILCQA